jgi:hypothetical protein
VRDRLPETVQVMGVTLHLDLDRQREQLAAPPIPRQPWFRI